MIIALIENTAFWQSAVSQWDEKLQKVAFVNSFKINPFLIVSIKKKFKRSVAR
jgi:hypothetical protein